MRHRQFLSRQFLLVIVVSVVITGQVVSADLFKVSVHNPHDAALLADIGTDAVYRLPDGYLVLADRAQTADLFSSGLNADLIATNITRSQLATDAAYGQSDRGTCPVVYSDDNVGLYRIDPAAMRATGWPNELNPVHSRSLPVIYRASAAPVDLSAAELLDLDSLIANVNIDSCYSYVAQLQDWVGRVPNSHNRYMAQMWLRDRLLSYGCDSVLFDDLKGINKYTGQLVTFTNVVGFKTGTVYPLNQIVLGAHYDSTPETSPGADDNGTGTSAVLEIARVLADLDTRFTYVFILFDGEETGLHGSRHYASEAFDRGDSIAVMINLDVIGNINHSDSVNVMGTASSEYADLWCQLADSLPVPPLPAIKYGAADWDAEGFDLMGYGAFTVAESPFSPLWHTSHDSIQYIDFDYMHRITQATLATTYVVNATHPGLPISISIPGSVPATVLPDVPLAVDVAIHTYGDGSLVLGSERLHYSVDGAPFVTNPLVGAGADLYVADFPTPSCGSVIRFFITAEEASSGLWCYPDSTEPIRISVGTRMTVVFEDDFDFDRGWTVVGDVGNGQWERAIPVSPFGPCVPSSGFNGSQYCYLTDNRDFMCLSDGYSRLLSPMIDVPTGQIRVEYARWFSNLACNVPDPPANEEDVFRVYLRQESGGFVLVDSTGPLDQASGGWFTHSFWVDDFFQPIYPLQLRFDATDIGEASVIEAAVDAVTVSVCTCAPLIITETVPDWTAGVPLSIQLEAVGGDGTFSWADKLDDLAVTGLTLASSGLLSGVPTIPGETAFTAVATDDETASDEKLFAFTVNAPVTIATEPLPDATAGLPYSHQLTSSGGTGTITWAETGDDLAALGMVLNADGTLSGSPPDTGTFTLTVRAGDELGSFDEHLFSLRIGPDYICGDIDNSGSSPDISDITYFVEWMFAEGPPPPVMAAANVDYALGGIDVDISDLTFMVDFLFAGGPPPACE